MRQYRYFQGTCSLQNAALTAPTACKPYKTLGPSAQAHPHPYCLPICRNLTSTLSPCASPPPQGICKITSRILPSADNATAAATESLQFHFPCGEQPPAWLHPQAASATRTCNLSLNLLSSFALIASRFPDWGLQGVKAMASHPS